MGLMQREKWDGNLLSTNAQRVFLPWWYIGSESIYYSLPVMKKYHLHVNNREKKNQQLYHNRSKHGTSDFPVKTARKKEKRKSS